MIGKLLISARVLPSALLDIVLPPLCVHCRRPAAYHGLLCASCWARIDFITHPLCDISGQPLPWGGEAERDGQLLISPAALASPPLYDRARSAVIYGGLVRDLIHRFKYGGRRESLGLFGHWLAMAGSDLRPGAALVMPVPLHRLRLWRRRFNQSALLAGELARHYELPLDLFSLARIRPTRTQTGLSASQRQRNVAGAFRVMGKKAVSGRRIILVDDVLTTGATANACARTLKKAGAEKVFLLTIARASPGQTSLDDFQEMEP